MAKGLRELTAQIRAAAASGDAAAVRPLLAEFRQKAKSAQRSQVNAREGFSALDGMSEFDKFHQGMASGLVNVARRGGQLLTPKSMEESLGVSDRAIESQETTDKELAGSGAGGTGRFLTEAAVTAPLGGAAGAGVKLGLQGVKAAPWLARAAGLAAEGATAGELTSGNAAEGAALNVGLAGLLRGAKKLVNGANMPNSSRRLLDEGVQLSPGQMNPRGTIAQLEQGAEHVPVIGAVMKKMRGQLEQTGVQRLVEKELGMTFPKNSGFDDMVREANRRLGRAYDNVRAQAGPVKPGGGWQMLQDWKAAVDDPNLLVSQQARDSVDGWLSGQFGALYKKGANVSGEDLLAIRQRIREQVRKHQSASASKESADIAELLGATDAAITKQIDAALPTQAARDLLKATDRVWAKYKPLEGVEFGAAARPHGDPTIGQIVGGLKKSAGQSRWAGRGAGRNQRFTEDLRDAAERTGRPTGAILPATIFGGVVSPALLLGATKTGSKIFSGRTGVQKGARKLARAARRTPGVSHMIEILRRGSAGPLSED